MSTEESILPMSSYKENPSNQSNMNSKTDEAQVNSTTLTQSSQTTITPVTASNFTTSSSANIIAQPTLQTQSKPVAVPSIQQSVQPNIIPVQLPTVSQQKSDPVTIHPAPLPIQPAPLTPQHVMQQTPQSQQHTPLRSHTLSATTTPQTTPGGKPPVGSEEWHRQRRENHKEVERRRRDTINAGINELAKIVPGCEKNKGSILNRAVQYIQQLKENEAANIEKWTLEKLLTDQAIQDLQTQVDMLKNENSRLRAELEDLQGPAKKKQRNE